MVSKADRRRTRRPRKHLPGSKEKGTPVLNRLLEHRLIGRVSFEEYKEKVRDVYDGPQGAILATCSMLSLHTPLGARLFRERKFDLRGARRILDVGSGAGQIAKHLIKYSDPQAEITCFDLSHEMLRRARNRLRSARPRFVVADLTRLPFADGAFDCATCGYVLEHLPDARLGLAELSRVLEPGGRMLLLTTEDTFSGAGRAGCGAAGPTIAGNWPGFARPWASAGAASCGSRRCTRCSVPAAFCVELVKE